MLDLRGDGGGYLPEATALTGLFIDQGPVVQLKDTTGRLEVLDDPEPGVAYAGPLAVLVDRFSASASEIFAGAIQDYHRGIILGQRTFGKGTVQNLVPLDRWSQQPVNGQLTVTIGKFYRVTGESTQHRGVEPDVAAALADRHEGSRRERARGGPALGSHRRRALPGERERRDRHADSRRSRRKRTRARRRIRTIAGCVADIAAIDTVREQTVVSLNLKTRARRSACVRTSERLDRENSRRAAKNLPRLQDRRGARQGRPKSPDIVLTQATEVMADMVMAPSARACLPARRRSKPMRGGRTLSSRLTQQHAEQIPGVFGEHVGHAGGACAQDFAGEHVAFGKRDRLRRGRRIGRIAITRDLFETLGAHLHFLRDVGARLDHRLTPA